MAREVEMAEVRARFNAGFTRDRYVRFLRDLDSRLPYPTDFRVAETPLFLSEGFVHELTEAAEEIASLLGTEAFRRHAAHAIPAGKTAPGEDAHPQLLQIDFGVACDDDGQFVPQLIELQGFPSLYCYQHYFDQVLRDHFDIPGSLSAYSYGLSRESYLREMSALIVGDADPRETVLLEIDPERQKTRIDFAATERLLDVKTVSVTSVRKRGRQLFYSENGRSMRIRRIYNRVVFDELDKRQPEIDFSFQDDLDVIWIPHPNWYYRISKHTLPFLKSRFVPACTLLSELDSLPPDLGAYVLKPLFSFAGGGVLVDVTESDIRKIEDPSSWILQRKVCYAPFVPTEDEPSRAEIRLLCIWKERPLPVTNLVRMSKGKMMGVDFNKDKTWVGSSIAYGPA
jgi:hypothetical protein